MKNQKNVEKINKALRELAKKEGHASRDESVESEKVADRWEDESSVPTEELKNIKSEEVDEDADEAKAVLNKDDATEKG